jgi:hypothetical protein
MDSEDPMKTYGKGRASEACRSRGRRGSCSDPLCLPQATSWRASLCTRPPSAFRSIGIQARTLLALSCRLTLAILFLPWQARSLITKLLHTKPSRRLGVTKGGATLIKSHPWFRDINWELLVNKQMAAPHVPTVAQTGAGCVLSIT